MPIFVAREWYRHQIGFARNEVSRRYVSDMPECWVPTFREKDSNLKQGSKETIIELDDVAKNVYDTSIRISLEAYDELLKLGVAPEVARTVLPQSMYTEFIETGSLAAYARLYKLRTSPDAQREIQGYADEIGKFIAEKFPVSWKALTFSFVFVNDLSFRT
jgi:thymidylate synthase (FAD)